MVEQKNPKDMTLGELVISLARLKEEFQGKLVDENHHYPEVLDKYGGIIYDYNQKVSREYEQRRKDLVAELQLYKK